MTGPVSVPKLTYVPKKKKPASETQEVILVIFWASFIKIPTGILAY